MNVISFLYFEVLFRPLYNLLVGITDLLPNHSIGLAIIIVTLVVRLILLPPSLHQARQARANQTKMSGVKEKIQAIKKEHKDDRTRVAEETMKIYREAGINPAAGCLPLLIQFPILIALYRVFFIGIGPETFSALYSFVPQPEAVSTVFLGLSLSEPSLILGILAGLGQFFLMRFFTPRPQQVGANEDSAQMMASMQKNMTYIFPVMTVFFALSFPAALSLYWVASTVFAMIQQYLIKRSLHLTEAIPTL
jgi:YidC/Oxa1 family membrane protein insertase